MLKKTVCIFDDYVPHNVIVYSSTMAIELLGRTDKLALHAILDDVELTTTNPGKLDIFLEGSSDGQNMIQRSLSGSMVGNGDITLASVSLAGAQAMWSDAALQLANTGIQYGPMFPYGRIRIFLSSMTAHLVVNACFRDGG